jgi:hypothetical protein
MRLCPPFLEPFDVNTRFPASRFSVSTSGGILKLRRVASSWFRIATHTSVASGTLSLAVLLRIRPVVLSMYPRVPVVAARVVFSSFCRKSNEYMKRPHVAAYRKQYELKHRDRRNARGRELYHYKASWGGDQTYYNNLLLILPSLFD